jgi:DNA helicase HerA-like ATPase
MSTDLSNFPAAAGSPAQIAIGRVLAVRGAQITVALSAGSSERATVGKFLGVMSGSSIIVGMITEIIERPTRDQEQSCRSTAQLDLVGEIKTAADGAARFMRGITEYPMIGESAVLMSNHDLQLIYNGATSRQGQIGVLQQDPTIGVHIDIDNLVSKHFAILGTTGVGKSTGVTIILQRILDEKPDLRIFLIDPHNEYGRCFGDKAQVLTPRNLRLPFWLFNFEETVDAFFGGRPGVDEEVEILSELIPLAKAAYGQYKGSTDRTLAKKKETSNTSYGVDTPVPYRIEDLIGLIDERMGKLENRSSRMTYHKLIQRIQTFRNHPRYGFMFENATVGGDTMADVLSHLFRLPPNGTPMTIMQLAGFPAEVVDSVVSVLSRMAFDFGLWSDGALPLLFICEEAHRYAPADSKIGFGPTRRALSRIAKEGRKYGVFLGLVTQRPAEIDPNIISQCSTLFVMRLSNDRDQHLIRSAVSDAAANLLSFIPSLGTAEVFVFGVGVPLPTRMTFKEVPAALRPSSEAGGNVNIAEGIAPDRDVLSSVIERWRASTMSNKAGFENDTSDWSPSTLVSAPPLAPKSMESGADPFGSRQEPPRPAPTLNPAYAQTQPGSIPPRPVAQQPSLQQAPAAAPAPQRPSILRKPIGGDPTPPPSAPPRWR